MNEWTEEVLGTHIDVLTDYHANGAYEKLKANVTLKDEPDYALMVRTLNFEAGDFDSNLIYLNQREYEFLSKSKVYPYDIVMNKIANAGSVYIMPDLKRPVSLAMNLFLIRFKKTLDQRFMYYNMKIHEPYIKQYANGTATLTITKDAVRNLKFSVPPLPTQKKIAKILSNYDDLIENNLKRIKLLEEKAQLTYEEWFLRFRIDGQKLDIDPETGLPFGWRKETLGNIVKNYDSKRIPLSKMDREKRQGDYPYYGAASVLDYVDDFIFDGKYLLMGEDGTVITKNGTPMLQFINCKFWVNNHTHVLEGTTVSTEFLYLSLNNYPISNHITGAAQPKINQQQLNRIPVSVAGDNTQRSFDEIVMPIFDEIFICQKQNNFLKEARDILLPRLMTSIIDTNDLEIAV